MGGNKMWVPTSHWGMGALTLYCMHFGITSQWCIRRTVTTPYWGMESLTSHGKALGSLLSTLCAECSHNPLLGYGVTNFTWQSTWKFALDAMCGERKRRCGGQEKRVLSASCWASYRALLTSSVLVSTLCPQFHPLVCLEFPFWLIDFLTRDCHLGHEVVRTVGFCHFLFVSFIINSSIFPISPFLVKTVIDVLFFSMDNGSLIRVLIYHL